MNYKELLEHIDAHVFTGDTFHTDPAKAELRMYMARWERALQSLEQDDTVKLMHSGIQSAVARIRNQQRIFEDVLVERLHQDTQWGGPEHDDTHTVTDWALFIGKQLIQARGADLIKGDARQHLVKIAALALAGIESIDRKGS